MASGGVIRMAGGPNQGRGPTPRPPPRERTSPTCRSASPVGRTFSYSDTRRHRVGPDHLQLPLHAPRPDAVVGTDRTGGARSYGVDNPGREPADHLRAVLGGRTARGRRVLPGVPPVRRGTGHFVVPRSPQRSPVGDGR
ncbi:catalase [Micromonospora coxensis]|uniref:catalase n=1 Tax=Micromonospora coxensis TaxID=356852 RepID=UPI0038CC114C